MCKSLHWWGVWKSVSVLYICALRAALWPFEGKLEFFIYCEVWLKVSLKRSLELWTGEREMLFHVSALPLANQLWCLFSLHLLGWISHRFACSFNLRRHSHRPPKSIGKKNGTFWRKLPVSIWLDALHNFKKQRHSVFFSYVYLHLKPSAVVCQMVEKTYLNV